MSGFNFDDADMTVTASHTLQNTEIKEHVSMVMANVTEGRHMGKDFMASIRNTFGGRSESWEKTLENAQTEALRELVEEAKKVDADAVVAVDIEDEVLGAQGGMMNIKVTGTAVKTE